MPHDILISKQIPIYDSIRKKGCTRGISNQSAFVHWEYYTFSTRTTAVRIMIQSL